MRQTMTQSWEELITVTCIERFLLTGTYSIKGTADRSMIVNLSHWSHTCYAFIFNSSLLVVWHRYNLLLHFTLNNMHTCFLLFYIFSKVKVSKNLRYVRIICSNTKIHGTVFSVYVRNIARVGPLFCHTIFRNWCEVSAPHRHSCKGYRMLVILLTTGWPPSSWWTSVMGSARTLTAM